METAGDLVAQQLIDQEIVNETAKYNAVLSALRQRRNMHSTINRLPNDILSLIFIEYKANFFPSDDYLEKTTGWVAILGICGHWRNIIMSTPRFWSFVSICLKDLPILPTMIQRSKAVPLTAYIHIDCDRYDSDFLPSITALMLQSSRIKDLHLFCAIDSFYAFQTFVKTLDLYPFPSLCYLKLELETDDGPVYHQTNDTYQARDLGQSLPWANMSSLRVLELSDVLIPPNVPPLPLLTELHVDCMLSTGDFVSLTLDWVSTFLKSTPNLTDLSLAELSPYDERTITTPLSTISLPKLKTISVHGADISTIKLFDFLELPLEPMKKVSFSCSSDPNRELDMVDIMGTLKALCARVASVRREHGLPISKVSLIEGLQPDYGLRLYGAYTLDPFLEVLLCDLSASEIFDICSSSIPLLQADELVIGGVHTSKTLQAWLTLLPSFENIKDLCLFDCRPVFLRGLFHGISASNCLGTLKVLSFDYIEWLNPEAEDVGNSYESWVTLDAIVKFYRKRGEIGLPIDHFVIRDCRITQHQIDSLRRHAVVDWDSCMYI